MGKKLLFENCINCTFVGQKTNSDIQSVAIFAMFDKEGKIPQNVVDYITELKRHIDYVVLVADNPILEGEIAKIENIVDSYKFERHCEYDFGSYKRGFQILEQQPFFNNLKYITFCNDSVIFQNNSLEDYFKKQKQYDFYGLTCNMYGIRVRIKENEVCKNPHIQSFFVSISDNIFRQNWFLNFIHSIRKQKSKSKIVIKYEIGLSALIKKHNFKLNSYYPVNETFIEPSGYYCNLNSPFQEPRLFVKKGNGYVYKTINPSSIKMVGQDSLWEEVFVFLQRIFYLGIKNSEESIKLVISILWIKLTITILNKPKKVVDVESANSLSVKNIKSQHKIDLQEIS